MKNRIILCLVILISFASCSNGYTQEKKSLQKAFLEQFINDNSNNNTSYFENNILYVLGFGYNFEFKNQKVIFIKPADINVKMQDKEKLFLISLEDFYIEESTIKTKVNYLIRIKKNGEFKLQQYDNTESEYCLEFIQKSIKVNKCSTGS